MEGFPEVTLIITVVTMIVTVFVMLILYMTVILTFNVTITLACYYNEGMYKYYISMFSIIPDPPPPLCKHNKYWPGPPTPPKMLT